VCHGTDPGAGLLTDLQDPSELVSCASALFGAGLFGLSPLVWHGSTHAEVGWFVVCVCVCVCVCACACVRVCGLYGLCVMVCVNDTNTL
jgi:hypothetical protein